MFAYTKRGTAIIFNSNPYQGSRVTKEVKPKYVAKVTEHAGQPATSKPKKVPPPELTFSLIEKELNSKNLYNEMGINNPNNIVINNCIIICHHKYVCPKFPAINSKFVK